MSYNPLEYRGVRAPLPPNIINKKHAPSVNDNKNFVIGDLWINNDITLGVNKEVYMLVDLAQNTATWALIYPSGGATSRYTEDVGTAHPVGGNVNVVGDNAVTTEGNNVDTITVKLTHGDDGEILIGSTAGNAEWKTITAGPGIAIFNGPNQIIISAGGGPIPAGVLSLQTDVGVEFPDLFGNMNVLGLPGDSIITSAPIAHTLYVGIDPNMNLDGLTLNLPDGVLSVTSELVGSSRGINGQTLIASLTGPAIWTTLTPGDGINIQMAGSTITIIKDHTGGTMPVRSDLNIDNTLALADLGYLILYRNDLPQILRVPSNADVAFPIGSEILLIQDGIGQLTVIPNAGVTINSALGETSFYKQYSVGALVKIAVDTWSLCGDLI
jgi:hypothetical protein